MSEIDLSDGKQDVKHNESKDVKPDESKDIIDCQIVINKIKKAKKPLPPHIKNIFTEGQLYNHDWFICDQCKGYKTFGIRNCDFEMCIHCIKLLLDHHMHELELSECVLCPNKKSQNATLPYIARKLCRNCRHQWNRHRGGSAEDCSCWADPITEGNHKICYWCAVKANLDHKQEIGWHLFLTSKQMAKNYGYDGK